MHRKEAYRCCKVSHTRHIWDTIVTASNIDFSLFSATTMRDLSISPSTSSPTGNWTFVTENEFIAGTVRSLDAHWLPHHIEALLIRIM